MHLKDNAYMKIIVILAFVLGINAYGQKKMFSDNLFVATTQNKIEIADFTKLTSHLNYLSKNYEKVFGEYNFSYDSNNFGDRNVYIGYGDRMHYQGSSAFILENQGLLNAGDFRWRTDYISGLISGAKLIFKTEKNYTKNYSDFKL